MSNAISGAGAEGGGAGEEERENMLPPIFMVGLFVFLLFWLPGPW